MSTRFSNSVVIGDASKADQLTANGDVLIASPADSVLFSGGRVYINGDEVIESDPKVGEMLVAICGAEVLTPMFDSLEIQSLMEAVEIAGREVGPASWGMSLQLLAKLEQMKGK